MSDETPTRESTSHLYTRLLGLEPGFDIPRVLMTENEPLVRIASSATIETWVTNYHDPIRPVTNLVLEQANPQTGSYSEQFTRLRNTLRNRGITPRSSE